MGSIAVLVSVLIAVLRVAIGGGVTVAFTVLTLIVSNTTIVAIVRL